MKKEKLTDKELTKLFVSFRKEDPIFDDLCDAHDEVVRVIGHNDIIHDALLVKKEEWRMKMDKMFKKLLSKKMKKGF